MANCEIYNWQELNRAYGLKAKNDSEALFRLLRKKGIASLSELDGVYAFAFLAKGKLILARDIIGVKPVWYSYSGSKGSASKGLASKGFAFASEKKALEHLGYSLIEELNPREIMVYTPETGDLARIKREFFSAAPQLKDSEKKIVKHLQSLIEAAVKKRIPARKFGVLFSGGVDSSTIALLLKKSLKKSGQKFTCYTVMFDDSALRIPEDLIYSQKVAEALRLDHRIIRLKLSELEKQLKVIVPLIEDSNVVKVEVALTFFAACAAARRDGCKVLFSGLGSEEIFAGYHRHKQVQGEDINKECISGLLKLYERDLYRDDVITMYHSLELRLPYLDKSLAEYALRIPGELKLKGGVEKYILRRAALSLGLPEEFALRRKLAAQYGSNMSKATEKLTKKNGFKLKSEYLRTFYDSGNVKLAAMISSGKDGLFAAYRMARQNYEITCFVTMKSANPDSYMFHTPNIGMAELQAKAAGIPIIVQKTEGEKEKELEDLEKALDRAKKEHGIQGVVTGALYSNYQRERIERVCDRLGLKVFSPLWHMDQEQELRQLLNKGFEIVFSSVAAEGLDKSWLGRPITGKDVDTLVQLHKKHGINIAGEGGEYESLVVDCPLFRQKIRVTDSDIIEEAEHTAKCVVKKVGLAKKTLEKTEKTF